MKHYHVIAGLQGGYIPNSNDMYPTRAAAIEGAQWLVDNYRDDGEIVRGSRKAGFWEARRVSFGFADYIEVTGPCRDDCEEWD